MAGDEGHHAVRGGLIATDDLLLARVRKANEDTSRL